MRRSSFIVLLLLTASVFAQEPMRGVQTVPSIPTELDEIELRAQTYCAGPIATAVRNGPVIDLTLPASAPCNPPAPTTASARIDPLPPGTYTVRIISLGTVMETDTFTVVPGPQQPLSVRPYAVPTQVTAPLGIRIVGREVGVCPDLATCRVFIGPVEATAKQQDPRGGIIVGTPQMSPGVYDVTVQQPSGTVTARRAIYIYNRNQPPDLAFFQRILFPVLFDAPGANGSHWKSEAVISNPKAWPVETYNDIQPLACIDYPCGERLAPRQKLEFTGGQHRNGIALLAPVKDAENLAFSLRIRDISREAEGFGTEIPVVREEDLFHSTMRILDVPVDDRYRVKLRVYAFDVPDGGAANLITDFYARSTRMTTPLPLTRNCTLPRGCEAVPYYAEFDLPAGSADERANFSIEIPAGASAWAFATVTNNRTQQVTIATPNGNGDVDGTNGEP